MRIKNNIYNFTFYPTGYEFNDVNINNNYDDLYTLNWLNIMFEFNYKGISIKEETAEYTNFEILNFIKEVEDSLNTKDYKWIKFDKLEPNFNLNIKTSSGDITINIHYNFKINDLFESIDFNVIYTYNEFLKFIGDLKKEYNLFPYRSISLFIDCCKYNSFNEVIDEIKKISNDKMVSYNTNSVTIKTHHFFNLTIYDCFGFNQNKKFYYQVVLNNIPLKDVSDTELIDYIKMLYCSDTVIIEYSKPKLFKSSLFVVDKLDSKIINKSKKDKKVSRIYNVNEVYYYNNKYLSLKENLIKDNIYKDIDPLLKALYYNEDFTERIQIIKNNDSYSYIKEKLEIREEREYNVVYNYAIWVKERNSDEHIYSNINALKEDIKDIISKYKLV